MNMVHSKFLKISIKYYLKGTNETEITHLYITNIYIVLVYCSRYRNTMTHVEELENQCVPISKLMRVCVIKVLVIHPRLTKEYKNVNDEGIR